MSNRTLSALLLGCTLLLIGGTATAATPTEIVNRRMQYYNEHKVDAMLDLYAEDIAVYTYPDRLLGTGKSHMRRVLEEIFADATVRVKITQQIANDSYVINEEIVSYAGKPTKYVSIYEVRDGVIRSVRFVRQ